MKNRAEKIAGVLDLVAIVVMVLATIAHEKAKDAPV